MGHLHDRDIEVTYTRDGLALESGTQREKILSMQPAGIDNQCVD